MRKTALGRPPTALRGAVVALVDFALEVCFPREAGVRVFLACFTPPFFITSVAAFFEEGRLAEALDLAPFFDAA